MLAYFDFGFLKSDFKSQILLTHTCIENLESISFKWQSCFCLFMDMN